MMMVTMKKNQCMNEKKKTMESEMQTRRRRLVRSRIVIRNAFDELWILHHVSFSPLPKTAHHCLPKKFDLYGDLHSRNADQTHTIRDQRKRFKFSWEQKNTKRR